MYKIFAGAAMNVSGESVPKGLCNIRKKIYKLLA